VERTGNVFVPGRDCFVYRVVVIRVALILKKTASIYRIGAGDDDYTVLDGDRVIGRIFLSPASPPDRNWMWTITARDYPPSIHSRGYCATREQAMADFKSQLTKRDS
jgi:hypothetical protein